MSDSLATAVTDTIGAPPTAIEPERVLVLTDIEQTALAARLAALHIVERQEGTTPPSDEVRFLARLMHGEEYADEIDELTRVTLRKRRLEAEVKRCNRRLEDLEPQVAEKLMEHGLKGAKHEATGASLSMSRKVWLKIIREGEKATPEEKARVGQALVAAGLDEFVKEDFNSNTVSAYFREQIDQYDLEQQQLPEHERVPRTVDSFIPEPLKGLIELTDDPTISVRAARN